MFAPTTLQGAIDRLGFVQADPIRSPARAQDLILRHRVRAYRAGDLERHYSSLDVEEDCLYAYGFLSRRVWHLLHPRKTPALRMLERKVLDTAPQPRRGASPGVGGVSRQTTDGERLGRLLKSHDERTGVAALARPSQGCEA